MTLRKKVPVPHSGKEVRHERDLIEKREQEPIKNLMSETAEHKLLGVAHVTPEELSLEPIEHVNPSDDSDEDEEVGEALDPNGIHDDHRECSDAECLLDHCECNSRNVLHSTATESSLAKLGTKSGFVGNVLGSGSRTRIVTPKSAPCVKEPKKLKERQIAGNFGKLRSMSDKEKKKTRLRDFE